MFYVVENLCHIAKTPQFWRFLFTIIKKKPTLQINPKNMNHYHIVPNPDNIVAQSENTRENCVFT